jgi:hypothetical protein
MRFDMSYAAAVSDPRIADESMTSELFSGLEGSNIGFLSPVFAFSRKGNSPPHGPRGKGAAACFIKVEHIHVQKILYQKTPALSVLAVLHCAQLTGATANKSRAKSWPLCLRIMQFQKK